MADDNFFNRSINDAAGATVTLDADGTVPEGATTVLVDASGGPVAVTLGPAAAGGCVTIIGTDITGGITVVADVGAGDNLTGLGVIDATNRALLYCADGGTGWYSLPTA